MITTIIRQGGMQIAPSRPIPLRPIQFRPVAMAMRNPVPEKPVSWLERWRATIMKNRVTAHQTHVSKPAPTQTASIPLASADQPTTLHSGRVASHTMRDSRSSHHNIVPPNRGWEEAKGEPLNDLGADGFLDENQDETEKKAAGTPFNWRKFASVAGLGLSFMLIIGLIWFSSKGAKPTINSELIFGAITGLFIATGMDCRRRRQPWDFYLGVIAFAVNWLAGQDWLANGVAAAFTTAAPNLGITSQTVPIIGAIIAVTLLVLLTFYGGRDLTVAGTFIAINALAQKTFEWGAIGKIIDIPGTTVAITICLVVTGLFYLGDIIKPVSDKFRLKSVILTLGSLVAIFVMANTIFKTLPFWVSGLVGFTLNFVLATDYGKSVEGKKAGSIGDLIKTMDDVVRESQYDSVALTTLIIVLWTTAGLPIYFNHA